MTPEERNDFENMKRELATLRDLFYKGDFPDKKVFYKKLVAEGGLDLTGSSISVGRSGGVVGLYGETPVAQAAAIPAPTGGATQDAEARTAINLIRSALSGIGITA